MRCCTAPIYACYSPTSQKPGKFAQAKEQFEKAMKLEPKNPTPYVNAALAELNTPPQPGQQIVMAAEACRLLEQPLPWILNFKRPMCNWDSFDWAWRRI
jgi:hypothetical protein